MPQKAGRAGFQGMTSSVCVCVCVCVFIELHITAQSGPVILLIGILCHSHWSSQGGINDTSKYLLRKPQRVCVFVCFLHLHINRSDVPQPHPLTCAIVNQARGPLDTSKISEEYSTVVSKALHQREHKNENKQKTKKNKR